jgi:putative transposase
MPIVDPEEFQRIGNDAERPVVSGPHIALLRKTLKDLVAWSSALQLKARRPNSWFAPPTPTPTPAETRKMLSEVLVGDLSRTEAGRRMIQGLVALADLVAEEDGLSLGLAGHLVDLVTSPGTAPNDDGIGAVAMLAIAADLA